MEVDNQVMGVAETGRQVVVVDVADMVENVG